jgi:DNA-directed RNA polymerase specialized sigma24 family protein
MRNRFVNQWRSRLRRRTDVVFDDELPGDTDAAEQALALSGDVDRERLLTVAEAIYHDLNR